MPDPAQQGDEYRFVGSSFGGWAVLPAALAPLAGAAGLVAEMALDDEVPTAVPIATGTFFAALFAFLGVLLHRARRTDTVCNEHGLTLRTSFRTHVAAWPDVQGIEIEKPKGSDLGTDDSPQRSAVLYDAAGGRYAMPHLDDRTRGNLVHDVAVLRGLWLERRGADWTPVPAIQDQIEHGRLLTRRMSLWAIGFFTAVGSFWAGLAIMLTVLASGAYPQIGDPEPGFVIGTLLHPVALMAGLPAVLTALVVAFKVHQRRR